MKHLHLAIMLSILSLLSGCNSRGDKNLQPLSEDEKKAFIDAVKSVQNGQSDSPTLKISSDSLTFETICDSYLFKKNEYSFNYYGWRSDGGLNSYQYDMEQKDKYMEKYRGDSLCKCGYPKITFRNPSTNESEIEIISGKYTFLGTYNDALKLDSLMETDKSICFIGRFKDFYKDSVSLNMKTRFDSNAPEQFYPAKTLFKDLPIEIKQLFERSERHPKDD